MYGKVKSPTAKEPGFNLFSFKDLYGKKAQLLEKVEALESQIETLEFEKDQIEHIAHRLKVQKVHDKEAFEEMKPEHKILMGHADGFTRFNFLKVTGD